MRWPLIALALLSLPRAGAAAHEQPGPETFEVGVAAVDITPDHPIRLNGFGFRRSESEGVRQRIRAKALAIGADRDGPAVLITVDALGIPETMVDALAETLRKRAGVDPAKLAVTATHTHTAPMINDVSPTLFGTPIPPEHQRHIDRYSALLATKLEEVALAALNSRRPATLSWALGSVPFAKNRRTKGGPVDHDLPMLVVKDLDGALRAVYVSYACHCVNLSDNRISGDWAGYAQELIERRHPKCSALVSIGCGADANPVTGVVGDRADVAEGHGMEIAEEVGRLLEGPLLPVRGPLSAKSDRIDLPLAPLPAREEWERRARAESPAGHHARHQLEKLDRGEKLATEIGYSIRTWSFADSLAIVFLPGEVVVDYSKRLKRELDRHRLWINAYSNGCPGYVPSERILTEGGYEGGGAMVYYGIPGPYLTGLEQKIVAVVRRQTGDDFSAPADGRSTQGSQPRTPTASAAALRMKPGFVAEVVAAEPLVASPVAIDFGPDGRLWVAEMVDYPSGPDGQFTPAGRIKTLRDDDGDGRYDRADTFLEGIPFPTGVTVWRDGVLVCTAPDILFARDTDGDGRADDVRTLFTGFATHNYQARVNSLEYGLDGWVHGACGLFGGRIESVPRAETIALGQRDFRIDPDRAIIEPASGRTQQGRARDDWGNWFGCTNGTLVIQFPLTERYLRRNRYLRPPGSSVGIATGADPGRLYPVSETVRFKLSGPANRVTAACGLGIYRDNLLGADYTGNVFTCEPVNNLVHRRVLAPNGSTFSARRADDESASEFLASTDQWFRPVQARTGPDGALWVVDMYRYVIEHPTWIPPETLAELDVRAGANRGRIYRVYHRDRPPRPMPRLDKMDSAGLVDALRSPNGPSRDMAQQLLLWRDDATVAGPLVRLATNAPTPETRVQALCTLAALGRAKAEAVAKALDDPHPGVRRQAIRLSEPLLNANADLAATLVRLCADSTAPIAMQLAYSLGAWNDPRAAQALARLAIRHQGDPYVSAAVFSSLNEGNVATVVQSLLRADRSEPLPDALIEPLLEQAAALADGATVRALFDSLAATSDGRFTERQFTRLAHLFEALSRRSRADKVPLIETGRQRLAKVLEAARTTASDADEPESKRAAAMELISRASDRPRADAGLLADLLNPRTGPTLQTSAVETLARLTGVDVPKRLLTGWPAHSPRVRAKVVETLLTRPDWRRGLLHAIEEKRLHARDIDLVSRQRLLGDADQALGALAKRLFADTVNADRQAVVERFTAALRGQGPAALRGQGDTARGKAVFKERCATCHRLENVGETVGPEITSYAGKPAEALLIALLDPNRAVDPRYRSYAVALEDGRVLSGLLADETATSLTLVDAKGKRETVLRVDVEQFRDTGVSLMPEGFERDVSAQQVADLVAYVRSLQAPAKSASGKRPKGGTDKAKDPASIARFVLGASNPEAERRQMIADHPEIAAPMLAVMVAGFTPGTPEEYRRIPWIWRVTIAAGKRNDEKELKALLLISLPRPRESMRDWQAVVLGGGLINGISQAGAWPSKRIEDLLRSDPVATKRWRRAIDLATAMADDEKVPKGTRYDALRIVAMDPWRRCGAQLLKYLAKGIDAELQMGAVSGLVDQPAPQATPALIEALSYLSERNRNLVLDGCLKTPQRCQALLDAIAQGTPSAENLGPARIRRLLEHTDPALRTRAKRLFERDKYGR